MRLRMMWIKGKPFYYYDTFKTITEAKRTARHYKKKCKSRYFIIETETGIIAPYKQYRLYMNKVRKLSFF